MKKINKVSTIILSIALLLNMVAPTVTFAATDPGLGAAAAFSIIAQTAITGTGTISGNVGINSTGAGITGLTPAMVGGIIYSTNGVAPSTAILNPAVQANLSTANDNISGQGSTASIGPVLDGLTLTAGVYDIGAGRLNGGVLTLDGPGIYIFRASSDFISSGSINLINGARACDVYWQVNTLATINGSSFIGTIIAGKGVHFGANVALNGRALALGGAVTLLNNTISGPICAVPPLASPILTVIKTVINNSGGTKVISDFPLFINGVPVTSGVANTTTIGLHTVSETSDPGYTSVIGGDCAADGTITLALGDVKVCTITNDDIAPRGGGFFFTPIPPIISVIKTPNPLALPGGQGQVTYTFTLRNIGAVPVTNITMVDDSCSPIVHISGDTNNDNRLDVAETWVYTCSMTLSRTHTNIVTATGWASGISATDIAQATVVVGIPVVPPLIHVTKVPSPLVISAGGGMITYTNKVTNPGTVPLSNVRLVDDKCYPVRYISGDTNGNTLLDINETWTYTCQARLTKTTVNTVTARGYANGLVATDFAIATVVVAAPRLPDTGIGPDEKSIPWNVVILLGVFAVSIFFYFARRKQIV